MAIPVVATQTVNIESTAVTTSTITKPSGTVENDLLFCFLTFDGTASSDPHSAPGGWTQIASQLNNGSQTSSAWFKVAGASEPANYVFTVAGATAETGVAGMLRITGAKSSDPFDVSASDNAQSGDPVTCPTVTTTNDNALVLRGVSTQGGGIIVDGGTPTSHTLVYAKEAGTSAGDGGGALYSIGQASSGATGTANVDVDAGNAATSYTFAFNEQPITTVNVTLETLNIAKQDTTVNVEKQANATLATLNIAKQDATVVVDINVNATLEALNFATFAAQILATLQVSVTTATLDIASQNPTVNAETQANTTLATLTLASFDPVMDFSNTVEVTLATLDIAAQDPVVNVEKIANATVESLSLAAQDTSISFPITVTATLATLSLAANAHSAGVVQQVPLSLGHTI